MKMSVIAPAESLGVGQCRTMPTPFLKWAGGKAKLLPHLVPLLPERWRAYHEPFVGGGAVFFGICADGPRMATLNDLNYELIQAYRVVRDQVGVLIETLKPLAREYLEADEGARTALYYEVRSQSPSTEVAAAARLLFLNRTCFNGLYRVNNRGEFNVPHGRYVRPRIIDELGLRECSRCLGAAELTSVDFEEACDRAEPGDLVYLDPPYQPLSPTASFTAYTSGAFNFADQERLREAFERLTRRGVAAFLSNSDHPAVEALYADRGYRIERVFMARAINSNAERRAPISELLIGNLSRPEVSQRFSGSPK